MFENSNGIETLTLAIYCYYLHLYFLLYKYLLVQQLNVPIMSKCSCIPLIRGKLGLS